MEHTFPPLTLSHTILLILKLLDSAIQVLSLFALLISKLLLNVKFTAQKEIKKRSPSGRYKFFFLLLIRCPKGPEK